MDLKEAARALGAKESEIVQVDDTPAGTRVVHKDGNAYIIVPEDNPDAEGNTGVMWLDPPPRTFHGETVPYAGNFPTFANPKGEAEIHAPVVEADADAPDGPSGDAPKAKK